MSRSNLESWGHLSTGQNARVHVILTVEKNRQTGEVIVHWLDHTLNGSRYECRHVHGVKPAVGKIEKQAIKLKKKIIDRKHGFAENVRGAPQPGRSGGGDARSQ